VAYSKKRGLDGVAITDHDTLTGALRIARTREIIIIPGVEVSTSQGHILAFNVSSPIPRNLRPCKTIRIIHEMGGIAVAPHPVTIYKDGIGEKLVSVLDFDAVEVINSTSFPFFLSTNFSRRLATRLKIPQTAGSDSHLPETIGSAYTLIESDPDKDEIIQAIKRGKTIPCGKPIPLTKRIKKMYLKLKSKKKVY
jgi:hypothetical protein